MIPAELYGQFSEHLGRCIYGSLWVGKDSSVPNIEGYRKDVFNALKDLKIPVMRWPGGCFADDYHWMDGIGPQALRAYISNNNWGGTLEDNSFGTHEFLNLCEMLGIQPYISGNVGSGSVEEMAKWVEYMTSDAKSTMADLRRKNGREKPWNVKYFGIGNEAWGCGGNMTPEDGKYSSGGECSAIYDSHECYSDGPDPDLLCVQDVQRSSERRISLFGYLAERHSGGFQVFHSAIGRCNGIQEERSDAYFVGEYRPGQGSESQCFL